MEMHLPNVCASCGTKPPTRTWTVKRGSVGVNPWSLVTMWFGAIVIRRGGSYEYPVPLCQECFDRANRERLIAGVTGIIGIIALIGCLFLIFYLPITPNFHITSWLAACAAIVLSIILMLVSSYVSVNATNFGSFDGSTFKYRSQAYHAAFAKLNPHLVEKH